MVKLIDHFVVEQDSLNYILGEERVSQKGKHKGEVYTNILGFYPSLLKAVYACRQELLRRETEDGCTALSDALERMEQADARFMKFLEENLGG